MPSPIQNIETRLTIIETKLDQILAQPALPPEVNLGELTQMLGQILGKTDMIYSAVVPQTTPDLSTQAQQALATLQQIQLQLSQQAQQIQIPNTLEQ